MPAAACKRIARRLLHRLGLCAPVIPPVTADRVSRETLIACIDRPDPVILEVGCNDGGQTRWFLGMFERPHIYCFEPDPRAIARFRAELGAPDNVELFEVAASQTDGTATFYQSSGHWDEKSALRMPEGWDLSGSLHKPKLHKEVYPKVQFDETIEVRTVALDRWSLERGVSRVDFMWLDVQGAERDVFLGAAELLKRTRYVYTEYSDRELYEGQASLRDLLALLPGFEVVERYPEDVLLINRRLEEGRS